MNFLRYSYLLLFPIGIFLFSTHAEAKPVGCQHLQIASNLDVGIWYPTAGQSHLQNLGPWAQNCVPDGPVLGNSLPLVMISHGTGGSWTSHYDTAQALANAGYVVVAPTEPGDNYHDHSTQTDIAGRVRALQQTLDYMLTSWPDRQKINSSAIGAFGFSAGGMSVFLLAGARPDFSLVAPWCQTHTTSFTCGLFAQQKKPVRPDLSALMDARIKAISVAAPALGFTLSQREALVTVRLPVQLWQAQNDDILPSPGAVEPVRDNLPVRADYHLIANAGHFDFLAPCQNGFSSLALCKSRQNFDRRAFHLRLNEHLVSFFNETLRNMPPESPAPPN